MPTEASSMGITGCTEPNLSDAMSEMTTTFLAAKATFHETTLVFHTANAGLPKGFPCASSARKKEISSMNTTNDSTKSTRGSSLEKEQNRLKSLRASIHRS